MLLTCAPGRIGDHDAVEVFSRAIRRSEKTTVYVPYEADSPSSGQFETFRAIAHRFGAEPDLHFQYTRTSALKVPECKDDREENNLIFRVRADGNESVKEALKRGWSFVEIKHVGSLLHANSAFRVDVIPDGAFRLRRGDQASVPVPDRNLSTLSIRRLLIGRTDDPKLPHWVAREIARILNEKDSDLAKAAQTSAPTQRTDRSEGEEASSTISRLLFGMSAFNGQERLEALGLPIHPAVKIYYNPRLSIWTWVNDRSELFGLLIASASIIASALEAMRRRFMSSGKDYADRLIDLSAHLSSGNELDENSNLNERVRKKLLETAMSLEQLDTRIEAIKDEFKTVLDASKPSEPAAPGPPTPDGAPTSASHEPRAVATSELQPSIRRLLEAQVRAAALESVSIEAGNALKDEDITEESFRTFMQTYRSARNSIDAQAETERRAISLHYVDRFMSAAIQPNCSSAQLKRLWVDAKGIIMHDSIFSRESFRTLTEAYSVAKSMIVAADVVPSAADQEGE